LRLVVLGGFGAIAWLGMALLEALRTPFPRPPLTTGEWIVLWLAALASAHLVLAVHELGHVVGGLLTGHRVEGVTVGPLALELGGRLRVRLNCDLREYGGVVRLSDRSGGAPRLRAAIVALSGPAASVIAGALVVAAGAAWLADPPVSAAGFRSYVIAKQAAVFGVGSVVVGLANLLPVSFSGRLSDGARLWLLLRGTDR
jgi:hypothetical protein